MKCLNPIAVKGQAFACGKCNFCLNAKKKDWAFRLNWEGRASKSSIFLTLTYDDDHVPKSSNRNTLRKKDAQNFMKALRKSQERWFKDQRLEQPDYPIRFYLVGEYGTKTHRPHYHALIFNLHPSQHERIPKIWNKGFIKIGSVSGASINYTAKYMIDNDKASENQPIEKPFALMSKNLGINYLHSNKDWHKSEGDTLEDFRLFVFTEQGHKQKLARYYKEKIFDRAELDAHRIEILSPLMKKRQQDEIDRMWNEFGKDDDKKRKEFKKAHHDNIKIKSQKRNTL